MPRRRVQRRQQNTRQPFVDVDRSADSTNNSTDTTAIWRHQDSSNIASTAKQDKMEYDSQNFNEFPPLSPTTPTQCCVPASSLSHSDDDGSTAPTKMDTGYADFAYWKPQLPIIDDEIAALLNDHPTRVPCLHQPSSFSKMSSARGPEINRDHVGAGVSGKCEFNEFNYWRKPIADVDVELESLQL